MNKHINNSLDADVQQYEQQQDFDPYELMYMNAYVHPVDSPLSPGIHHFTLLPL